MATAAKPVAPDADRRRGGDRRRASAPAKAGRPALIDYFVPEAIRRGPAAVYDRAHLLVVCSLALGVWGPIFAVIYAWLGVHSLALPTLAAGLAAAATPLLFRATGRLGLCAAFLCAEVFALLAYSAYRVAGWQNGTLWWIPCIPMLATVLMGIPAGVAAAAASFVVYAAFHLLFDAGFQPAETMTPHDLSLIHMLAMCGITIVTLSFAAAFEAGKKAAIGRLTGEIADRRGVEEALRRSEARLANAQRIARIGGWEWDLRSGEIAVTGDARTIFALRGGATLTQERFLALIHPEDLPRVLAETERSVREASRMSLDHRLLLPGGVEKVVHLEAEIEFDAGGEPARRVGFVQDVTERRRADAALRETEEKLRQSQKMEAIGRLAGGIAHDFNNLLSVIQGYAEVSAERPDVDASLAADLREIVVAARRAAALTGGLLAFSRKQTVQPTTLNLNEVVDRMGKLLRRVIGEDVTLTVDAAPDLGLVQIDRHQIEQVLMNLAVNARDAMPGGGALTIATANVGAEDGPEDGDWVMLAVTDTGVGMDEAVKARIFEPFFTTKDPGRGTGLGLPMAYGAVQQGGGHIRVISEPGKGATFRLYFPRVREAGRPGASEGPAEGADGSAAGPDGVETVLVVEDEGAVRELVRRVLERAGYRVLAAGDAREAMALFDRHGEAVDLVLTDVIMPALDGPTLVERLRMERPHLPALFMSGYTDDALGRHGVTERDILVLPKPFTQQDLLQAVRATLDEAAGAPAPAA